MKCYLSSEEEKLQTKFVPDFSFEKLKICLIFARNQDCGKRKEDLGATNCSAETIASHRFLQKSGILSNISTEVGSDDKCADDI